MKSEAANLICHFVEVGEYGLALEELAGYLALAGTPITGQERNDMIALAAKMQMDDNVPLTLAFCPRVTIAQASPHARRRPPENGGCRARAARCRPIPVQAGT